MNNVFNFDPKLPYPKLLNSHKFSDYRGELTRVFDMVLVGWDAKQVNVVHNNTGVLRGMHWQIWPRPTAKAITCIAGKIQDVIVDLRPYSSTYMKKYLFWLGGNDGQVLVVPEGFAHGFYAYAGNPVVVYGLSACYDAEYERSFNFQDSLISHLWDIDKLIISEKDRYAPMIQDLQPEDLEFRPQ